MHILNFDRLEEDFEANSYYVAAASYLQQLKALLLQESVEDDLEAVNDRALLRFCKAIKLAKVVDGKIQDNSGTLRKQITDIEEFLERAKRVFNLFAKIGEDGALFDKLQGLSAESHDTNIMQFLSRTKLSELGKVDAVSLISMERFGKELIGGGASAYFPELGDLIGKHLQHFPHEKVAEDAEYAVNSVLNGLGVTVGDLSELNRFVNGTDAKNRIEAYLKGIKTFAHNYETSVANIDISIDAMSMLKDIVNNTDKLIKRMSEHSNNVSDNVFTKWLSLSAEITKESKSLETLVDAMMELMRGKDASQVALPKEMIAIKTAVERFALWPSRLGDFSIATQDLIDFVGQEKLSATVKADLTKLMDLTEQAKDITVPLAQSGTQAMYDACENATATKTGTSKNHEERLAEILSCLYEKITSKAEGTDRAIIEMAAETYSLSEQIVGLGHKIKNELMDIFYGGAMEEDLKTLVMEGDSENSSETINTLSSTVETLKKNYEDLRQILSNMLPNVNIIQESINAMTVNFSDALTFLQKYGTENTIPFIPESTAKRFLSAIESEDDYNAQEAARALSILTRDALGLWEQIQQTTDWLRKKDKMTFAQYLSLDKEKEEEDLISSLLAMKIGDMLPDIRSVFNPDYVFDDLIEKLGQKANTFIQQGTAKGSKEQLTVRFLITYLKQIDELGHFIVAIEFGQKNLVELKRRVDTLITTLNTLNVSLSTDNINKLEQEVKNLERYYTSTQSGKIQSIREAETPLTDAMIVTKILFDTARGSQPSEMTPDRVRRLVKLYMDIFNHLLLIVSKYAWDPMYEPIQRKSTDEIFSSKKKETVLPQDLKDWAAMAYRQEHMKMGQPEPNRSTFDNSHMRILHNTMLAKIEQAYGMHGGLSMIGAIKLACAVSHQSVPAQFNTFIPILPITKSIETLKDMSREGNKREKGVAYLLLPIFENMLAFFRDLPGAFYEVAPCAAVQDAKSIIAPTGASESMHFGINNQKLSAVTRLYNDGLVALERAID